VFLESGFGLSSNQEGGKHSRTTNQPPVVKSQFSIKKHQVSHRIMPERDQRKEKKGREPSPCLPLGKAYETTRKSTLSNHDQNN